MADERKVAKRLAALGELTDEELASTWVTVELEELDLIAAAELQRLQEPQEDSSDPDSDKDLFV